MAPRRKAAPMIKTLAAAAVTVVVGLVTVALIVPSPRRSSAPATQPARTAEAARPPLMPSYVVRIPPPAPERPAGSLPAPVSLSVAPVAAAEEAERPSQKYFVTARALNVRSAPDSQSAPVGALPRGTAVAVTETEGNWMQVSAGDVTGWAFAKYLSQTPP